MEMIREAGFFVGLFGVFAGVWGTMWGLCSYIGLFYGFPRGMAIFFVYITFVSLVLYALSLIAFSLLQVYLGYTSGSKTLIAAGIFAALLGVLMFEVSLIAWDAMGSKHLFEFIALVLALLVFLIFTYVLQFIYSTLMAIYFYRIGEDLGLAGAILTLFYIPIGYILQGLALMRIAGGEK